MAGHHGPRGAPPWRHLWRSPASLHGGGSRTRRKDRRWGWSRKSSINYKESAEFVPWSVNKDQGSYCLGRIEMDWLFPGSKLWHCRWTNHEAKSVFRPMNHEFCPFPHLITITQKRDFKLVVVNIVSTIVAWFSKLICYFRLGGSFSFPDRFQPENRLGGSFFFHRNFEGLFRWMHKEFPWGRDREREGIWPIIWLQKAGNHHSAQCESTEYPPLENMMIRHLSPFEFVSNR